MFKDFIKFGVNFVKSYPYDLSEPDTNNLIKSDELKPDVECSTKPDAKDKADNRQEVIVQLSQIDQSNLLDISNSRTPVVNISQVDNVKKQQEEDSFTIKRTPAGQ